MVAIGTSGITVSKKGTNMVSVSGVGGAYSLVGVSVGANVITAKNGVVTQEKTINITGKGPNSLDFDF